MARQRPKVEVQEVVDVERAGAIVVVELLELALAVSRSSTPRSDQEVDPFVGGVAAEQRVVEVEERDARASVARELRRRSCRHRESVLGGRILQPQPDVVGEAAADDDLERRLRGRAGGSAAAPWRDGSARIARRRRRADAGRADIPWRSARAPRCRARHDDGLAAADVGDRRVQARQRRAQFAFDLLPLRAPGSRSAIRRARASRRAAVRFAHGVGDDRRRDAEDAASPPRRSANRGDRRAD